MAVVLFSFAHIDDETLAAGGAIAEHVAAGHDVHLQWQTRGEASGVRGKLNATSPTPNSWWGVMHNPAAEGYPPLTVEEFGLARLAEGTDAAHCLATGYPGTLTLHEENLGDGVLTAEAAYNAILTKCDEIAPGAPVRIKGHTYVPELDTHPDHIAIGQALQQLHSDAPTRFGDVRFYVLPYAWNSPHLSLVDEAWDYPTDPGVAARHVNACRAYGAWAPAAGRFAVGHHSTYGYFATVLAGPKCLFHT